MWTSIARKPLRAPVLLAVHASAIGVSSWLAFEKATSAGVLNAAWISRDFNSQYVVHVGLRWFEVFFRQPGTDGAVFSLALAGYLIAASCVAASWWLQRGPSGDDTLSIVPLFLSIPFVIKTSWPHYFVYLPPCQAALLHRCWRSGGDLDRHQAALRTLPVLSIALSSAVVFNVFPNWMLYYYAGVLFFSNLLLVAALQAIVVRQALAPRLAAVPATRSVPITFRPGSPFP